MNLILRFASALTCVLAVMFSSKLAADTSGLILTKQECDGTKCVWVWQYHKGWAPDANALRELYDYGRHLSAGTTVITENIQQRTLTLSVEQSKALTALQPVSCDATC